MLRVFANVLIDTYNHEHCIEEAVSRLANSLELRQRLGQQAQQIIKRYTWEYSALMLEKLFGQVIASEGQTSE